MRVFVRMLSIFIYNYNQKKMASISTKLFVNASTYEDFSKITPSDKKIYFINDTKQIYAKGIYYGVSASDFDAVKKALNGYLSANNKTVAEAIEDAIKEIDGKVTASKTLKIDGEAYETDITVAITRKDDEKVVALLNNAGTILSYVKVSDIIGSAVLTKSAYDASTGILTLTFGEGDAATAVEIDLKELLDIDDIITDGTYLSSTVNTVDTDKSQLTIKANVAEDMAALTGTEVVLADAVNTKNYVDDKVAEVVTAYEAADAAIITSYQTADDKLYTTYIKPNTDAIEVLNGDVDAKGSVTYTATYIVTSTMNDLDNYWDTL